MYSIKKGFTLIELLVVIAIIGILATLVVTQVAGAQVKARNSSAQSDVTAISKGVEIWKTDQGDGSAVLGVAGAAGTRNVEAYTLHTIVTTAGVTRFDAQGRGAWTTIFSGSLSPTSYGVSANKVPSTSYAYSFLTNANDTSYCVGTNIMPIGHYSYYNGILNSNTTSDPAYGAAGPWLGTQATCQ